MIARRLLLQQQSRVLSPSLLVRSESSIVRSGRRYVSVSTASSTPSAQVATTTQTVRGSTKGRGRLGATMLGFFMGATLTGVIGWYEFLDDYLYASRTLLESVEDLESSTRKVRDYARKIEKVETTLRRLEEQAITQTSLEDMRKELRTIMDANEESRYAWRGRIVELEKDVNTLLKKAQRI